MPRRTPFEDDKTLLKWRLVLKYLVLPTSFKLFVTFHCLDLQVGAEPRPGRAIIRLGSIFAANPVRARW